MSYNPMKIFLGFIAILIISFFAIGFVSGVDAPTDATALAQYNNLTEVVGIADTGMNATLLILIAAMAITACLFMIGMVKKR